MAILKDIVEEIKKLPLDDKEVLMYLLKKQIIEEKRNDMVKNYKEILEEYGDPYKDLDEGLDELRTRL